MKPGNRSAMLAIAILLGLIALLGGCSSDALRVNLDQAGPFELEVGPCVQLATSAQLREDQAPVNSVILTITSADQRVADGFYYDVTGDTQVRAGNTLTYQWSCTVHVDSSGKKLDAELTSFVAK